MSEVRNSWPRIFADLHGSKRGKKLGQQSDNDTLEKTGDHPWKSVAGFGFRVRESAADFDPQIRMGITM